MSYMKKAAALALAGVLAAGSLAGCGKKEDGKIDGTKTLMTVNGEEVKLGVGAFYARFSQAQIYQFYTAYFGLSSIFDGAMSEGSDETYGDYMKESVLSELEEDVVIRQHAEEYGVSLTDEEKAAIEEAADDYMAKNSDEVREKIGAGRDDLVELMSLQTYQSKMMDPIVKDVDTEVSDEEGQMSSLTYFTFEVAEETADSGVESAAVVVEPVADTESTASSGAESVAEEVAETPQMAEAKAKAQHLIDEILSYGVDVAGMDLDTIAQMDYEEMTSSTGEFETYHTEDAGLDAAIIDAVQDLEDGTLVDHPILSTDGTEYYVVRFDKAYDEELTESNKSSIVTTRKQTLYDETTDGWVSEAEIKVNDDVWKAIVLTDMVPFTLAEHVHEHEDETESAAESIASVVEVESIAEPIAEAVTETISLAEEAAADTVSLAEAASAEAASIAENVAETAAAAADNAAETAAAVTDNAADAAADAAGTAETAAAAAVNEEEDNLKTLKEIDW